MANPSATSFNCRSRISWRQQGLVDPLLRRQQSDQAAKITLDTSIGAHAVSLTLRRKATTLAIAAVGAAAALAAGLPLPLLLGPLLACLLAALLGAQPALLHRAIDYGPAIALVILLTAAIAALGIPWFRSKGFDRPTAFYAAMPGGLQDMLLFGMEAGANPRALSLAHATRLTVVVTTVGGNWAVGCACRAPQSWVRCC